VNDFVNVLTTHTAT